MRKTTIVGGLAAAAGALALLLLWSTRAGSEHAGAAPDAPARAAAAAEPIAPALPETRGEAPEAPAALPDARDAVATAAAPAPTCLVRVVEKSSGAPVPDARLWIQDDGVHVESPAWRSAMRRFNDVEPVLASGLGHEVALDERGEARVPRPARALLAAAARGALHGGATLKKGAETCVVELKPYHALVVEVVDRAGKPVPRAPVVLFWGEFDPAEDSTVLPCDDEGRLSIAKLEGQVFEHAERGTLRVAVAGGAPCEPELVEFTLDDVPSEPVRFVTGDFGSVVLQLTDPQGRELALEGMAHVDLQNSPLPDPPLALRASAWLEQPLENGRARFPAVGLGLPLYVQCYANGHETGWRELTGPTTAGEELLVSIPLGELRPSARGRVVGIDGDIDGGGTLRCVNVSLRWPFWARVGDDGTFEFYPDDPIERFASAWELQYSRRDEPPLGAVVEPRVDAERRVVDFGDVAFEPLGELARVRVVDAGGAPVAATVQVFFARRSVSDDVPCDAQGLATLRGRIESLPMKVRALDDGCLPTEWVAITTAGEERTLTLRRGAALEGRVLLPRGSNVGLCEIELAPILPDGSEGRRSRTEPVEGGRFRFLACEPGRATLRVGYDGQPVLERAGIELVLGETTRLPDIDLRAELRSVTLTFALASGAPWIGGHLQVIETEGETSSWTRIGPSARVTLLSPHALLAVWVAGHGARPTRFDAVSDGDRLVLPDACAVVLQLPRGIALPEPPLELVVRAARVTPEEVAFETDEDWDGNGAVVGSDGRVRLSAPWPGEYELEWIVRHTGTGVEWEVASATPQSVAIDDASAATIVDALLTVAELSATLAEAHGR